MPAPEDIGAHLSPKQMEDYCQNVGSTQELKCIDQHVSWCTECSQQMMETVLRQIPRKDV